MLGQWVEVVIDRPLGSTHPQFSDIVYPINYGYIPGMLAGDGEEQDVYVLGVQKPLQTFCGRVIAVIHRKDDNEDKWVVAPEGTFYTAEEICSATHFVEQYFDSEIILFDCEGVNR